MSHSEKTYDVLVIGGGASGMLAAGRAAERGKRVLLLEKNKELGKKLAITGGGRCNILNAEEDTHALLEHYGDAAKFLHSPFSQHGMRDSWEFFEAQGLPLVVEARKRAFPASQQAPDVVRTLKRYMASSGVDVRLGVHVTGLVVDDAGRITGVETPQGSYHAAQYILATGGASHQETGSTGESFAWLSALGYTIHEPNPNIVPLVTEETWSARVSGTTLSFMKITFGVDREKRQRFSRTGKILFTHFGISGPLVLNAAHDVKKLLHDGPVVAHIDMYPDTDSGALRRRILTVFDQHKNKEVRNALKECVPHGMSDAVATLLPDELCTRRVHSVSKEEREAFADMLKAMPLTIIDTMGMDWAVISDGGVDLSQVDTKTMRSRLHDNFFFTGDVLHVNRPSGGYSLQLCWTTGWVAGSHA